MPTTVRRLTLVIGHCSLVIALTACMPSDADKKSLQQGYADYNARRLDAAESAASDYLKKNPAAPNIDEAYYLRALARLGRGDKAGATEDLRLALEKTQRPDLQAKAHRTLGDIDYQSVRWNDALDQYQQALALTAASPEPYLYYRIGECMQCLGQWDAARPYFQRVAVPTAAAPDPVLAPRALARMYASSFALQYAALPDPRQAAALKTQLASPAGGQIKAVVTTELREGKLLFLVRSGSYPTLTEADTARSKLLAKYPLVTIVP